VRVNHYHNLHRTHGRVRALLERYAFAPLSRVLERLAEVGRLRERELDAERAAA
jgi:hypothetical protein